MNRITYSNLSGSIISCVWVVCPKVFAVDDPAAVNGAAASESRFILSLRIDGKDIDIVRVLSNIDVARCLKNRICS